MSAMSCGGCAVYCPKAQPIICYWSEEDEAPAAKQLLEAAEADAYATSLPQAVELCITAAKGELKPVGSSPS